MPLTLQCLAPPSDRLRFDPWPVDALQQGPDALSRLSVWCGRERLAVADCFRVIGCFDDEAVIVEGATPMMDGLGRGWSRGRLLIHGVTGDFTTVDMTGGAVTVEGSVGHRAAERMSGGRFFVTGNAGDSLACGRPGDPRGITGGEVFVLGNAGHEAGTRMRRGLIAIGGDAGSWAGANMIAGTVLVGGTVGPQAAWGCKRGSLVALSDAACPVPSGWRAVACAADVWLRLMVRHLQSVTQGRFAVPGIDGLTDLPETRNFERYQGDPLTLNRGEILRPRFS